MTMFVALDFPNWKQTEAFLYKNELQGVPVKVGMELFYKEGPKVIEKLKKNNHSIFLDLKLHDIPNTVHRAMKNIASLGVDLVTTHTLGGSEMITQAKLGLEQSQTKLIAVTLLTSVDEEVIQQQLRLAGNVPENVDHLARLAKDAGADGVVSSVHEVEFIKKACDASFLTLTPGIRFDTSNVHDQKRVATPEMANQVGSDFIVVGRAITQSDHPYATYMEAKKRWEGA
ncbi:orotidine-5'-phosphate decarboxylase [Oceanobacillus sp. 1P07AA]|uniref:orotidine-5'-phosphate decarboxylase n=1 Tax=Oceanobacillus sp. 1P07AA TaxID=3132293 RepID=UPI0039A4317A